MGLKKIRLFSCFLCVILFFCSCSFLDSGFESQKYTNRLLKKLKSDEVFQVKDIFDFDFDRAYVIKDNYISGTTFAEEYDLDLSIDEVGKTSAEIQRRIVFVDAEGKYVFEYQYSAEKLCAKEEGFIIYPETKMRRTEKPLYWDIVTFEFLEIKPTDYYGYCFGEVESSLITKSLLPKLQNEEIIRLGDVVDFSFDFAYVMEENLSGVEFSEKYGLNLSIGQAGKARSERIRRIVFVNENGQYVFCYYYHIDQLIVEDGSFFLTPDTKIRKTGIESNSGAVRVEFLNYF